MTMARKSSEATHFSFSILVENPAWIEFLEMCLFAEKSKLAHGKSATYWWRFVLPFGDLEKIIKRLSNIAGGTPTIEDHILRRAVYAAYAVRPNAIANFTTVINSLLGDDLIGVIRVDTKPLLGSPAPIQRSLQNEDVTGDSSTGVSGEVRDEDVPASKPENKSRRSRRSRDVS